LAGLHPKATARSTMLEELADGEGIHDKKNHKEVCWYFVMHQ